MKAVARWRATPPDDRTEVLETMMFELDKLELDVRDAKRPLPVMEARAKALRAAIAVLREVARG